MTHEATLFKQLRIALQTFEKTISNVWKKSKGQVFVLQTFKKKQNSAQNFKHLKTHMFSCGFLRFSYVSLGSPFGFPMGPLGSPRLSSGSREDFGPFALDLQSATIDDDDDNHIDLKSFDLDGLCWEKPLGL